MIADVENGNMACANRLRSLGNEIDVDIPDRDASTFRDNSPRDVAPKAGRSPSDNSRAAGKSALENFHAHDERGYGRCSLHSGLSRTPKPGASRADAFMRPLTGTGSSRSCGL